MEKVTVVDKAFKHSYFHQTGDVQIETQTYMLSQKILTLDTDCYPDLQDSGMLSTMFC